MESWQRQRGKILRLPMAELAQVCLACARVKYFDSQSFADIIAAVKVHLRSYIQLKADDVGARKVILDAFKKVKHRSENTNLVVLWQDAPLDLGTEAFYPSRSTAIEARLGELAAMSAGDVAADVRQNFRRLQGWRIRGVRWDRYDATGMFLPASSDPPSPNDEKKGEMTKAATRSRVLCTSSAVEVSSEDRHLAAAAGAMGGRALAAALRLLCEDYNSAGLPDLLLWSWQSTSPRARFVEVKSERDTLARRQRLWLSTLRAAGAEAEVCHVRDGHVEDILIRASSACESHSMWLSSADRFEQEVFQNKIRQRRKRAASEGSSEGF
eukprot:g1493.t1